MDIFQSGLCKLHSTETALLKVCSNILMAADSGEYTVLVILDLTSALDTVQYYSIMINKFKDLFGNTGVLKWFMLYRSEKTFTVCMDQVFQFLRLFCWIESQKCGSYIWQFSVSQESLQPKELFLSSKKHRLRLLVPKVELEMIIHVFISSHLDYCLFTCFNKYRMLWQEDCISQKSRFAFSSLASSKF